MTADPEELDPEYARHGGFPRIEPTEPTPAFARFVATMRRVLDLAVSANPDDDTWEAAADGAEHLVGLLGPFEAAEGMGPAGRSPDLPGMGSLLLPPWSLTAFAADGVEMRGHFSRFHVGGNSAVHGGVLPLLFDQLFGMVAHAAGRPISRTAFLHVDYRSVTPINTALIARGRVASTEGRKAFVTAEITDTEGKLLAESHGLMLRLLPGQP